jgi:hypothetical protein
MKVRETLRGQKPIGKLKNKMASGAKGLAIKGTETWAERWPGIIP